MSLECPLEFRTLNARSSLKPQPAADAQQKSRRKDHMLHQIAKRSIWLVPALLIGLCPIVSHAQAMSTMAKMPAMHKHASVKATGCLQKGESATEFSLTGKDGKTWELHSTAVKLAEHVGHTVTVTGVPHHETKAEEAKEAKTEPAETKDAEAKEAGDLLVTSLKMVSETCTQ
jgi:hypothetical protein